MQEIRSPSRLATQVAQGGNLFNGETFQGNGRTCATCHVASLNFCVAAEQYSVAIQYRIHDVRPAIHRRDEAVQLRCRLRLQSQHAGSDRHSVERRAMHRYVAGHHHKWKRSNSSESQGADAGFADDVSCLRRHEPGLVRHRERQQLMFGKRLEHHSRKSGRYCRFVYARPGRSKADEDERGHGELPSGPWSDPGKHRRVFRTPNVFRKSPHLLNLSQRFGSFGLSGSVNDLQSFATGAITQHFPRTLNRNSGGTDPDFRLLSLTNWPLWKRSCGLWTSRQAPTRISSI